MPAIIQSSLTVGSCHINNSSAVTKRFNTLNGNNIFKAGPSTPVILLGLNGAPTAGDIFNVMENEQESKKIATKRIKQKKIKELKKP